MDLHSGNVYARISTFVSPKQTVWTLFARRSLYGFSDTPSCDAVRATSAVAAAAPSVAASVFLPGRLLGCCACVAIRCPARGRFRSRRGVARGDDCKTADRDRDREPPAIREERLHFIGHASPRRLDER